MTRNSSSEARNIKDGQPFCWQEKGALRLIRQSFEGDTSSALLTYVALTEIASDQKSETFQASASYIASKAKLTSRTVTKFIEPLEKLKLIAVKRTKVPGTKAMASNTYTLLNVVNLFPYRKRQGSKLSENRRIKNKETHPSDGHSSPPAQSTHPSTKDDTSAAPTRSVFEEKEDGYLIGNRFFPSREANRIAAGNEDMLLAAKRAVRFQDGSVKGGQMRRRWRDYQLARSGYSEAGLAVIRMYNEICVPHGFLSVNSFSEALHEALEIFTEAHQFDEETLRIFRLMFTEAVELRNVGEPIYNTPRGAKLLRILWNNY